MDRPPSPGWEADTFTSRPASEWDEHWVGIDVPTARRLTNQLLDTFREARPYVGLP